MEVSLPLPLPFPFPSHSPSTSLFTYKNHVLFADLPKYSEPPSGMFFNRLFSLTCNYSKNVLKRILKNYFFYCVYNKERNGHIIGL